MNQALNRLGAFDPKDNLQALARTDPKGFLTRVQCHPIRIDLRLERLEFFRPYIDYPEVKEHCRAIAEEVQFMLDEHRQTEELFERFAGDLTGYAITKGQFFYGYTLKQWLCENPGYAYRWAQELQRRTLETFQQRIEAEYDK